LNTANPVVVQTGGVLNKAKATWLVGAELDWGDNNLLYAKVNTGFKSGTVNAVPPGIGVPLATDPEEVTAYQIGSKNRFLDNRLQVNAEAFFYDYEGYQVVVIATDPTGFFPGQFFPSTNAQKAEFKGGEIEVNWLVSDVGQLDLAVTLLDAKHVEFVTRAFNWSGNDVQRAPPYTVTAGYRHRWYLSNGNEVTARISSQYVDANYTRDANLPGDWQEAYTNTSANVAYQHGNWNFSAWVRNLEDEAVIALSRSADRGGYSVFMFPPRTYGFTVKYEY
jgi:iron complex outermembrane receptor protein